MLPRPVAISRTRNTVVSAVTTSSTKMTGFLARVRGSSLTNAARIAGPTILGSSKVAIGMRLRTTELSICVAPKLIRGEQGAANHRQMLDDGSECECREKRESTNDQNHAHDQSDK